MKIHHIKSQIISCEISIPPASMSAFMHSYFGEEEYPGYKDSHSYSPIQFMQHNGQILIQAMGDEAADFLMLHHIQRNASERFAERAETNKPLKKILNKKRGSHTFSMWPQSLSEIKKTDDNFLYSITGYIPFRDMPSSPEQNTLCDWAKFPELKKIVSYKVHHHINEFLNFAGVNVSGHQLSINLISPFRANLTSYKASSSSLSNRNDWSFDFHFTSNFLLPPYLCLGTRKRYGKGKTILICP